METKEFPEIEAMRMGVDYRGTIKIRDFSIPVRPLSMHEYVSLMHEVANDVALLPEKARTPIMEHSILAKKTLIKATSSEVGGTDYKLNDQMLNRMTMNEVIALYKEYAALEARVNPILEEIPNDKLKEMVEYLKKSPSELTQLSFLELRQVAQYLLTNDD